MKNKLNHKKILFLIFLVALNLRILMIFAGYHGDLNNNISWGKLSFERGLSNFYESGNWPFSAPNQPPLTILLFYFVSSVWNILTNLFWYLNNNLQIFPSAIIWFWEKWGMIILIKLPSIIADLGLGWIIYSFVSKNSAENKTKAILLTFLWLFNPVSWYNSAIWGQTDPIVNILGLVGIIALLQKRLPKFLVSFTLSILFKGSLVIFAPLLFVVALLQKYLFKEWIKGLLFVGLTILVLTLPFHSKPDLPLWLGNLYLKTVLPGEIGYLTANAFNFWWLINPGRLLDSEKILNISYRTYGFVIFILFYILVLFKTKKFFNTKTIIYGLGIVTLSSFLFMTRIHERYMYPFFPLATLLLYYYPSLIYLYLVLSTTFVLNMFNLFWIPTLPHIRAFLEFSWAGNLLSMINIIIFVILVAFYIKSFFYTKKAG